MQVSASPTSPSEARQAGVPTPTPSSWELCFLCPQLVLGLSPQVRPVIAFQGHRGVSADRMCEGG